MSSTFAVFAVQVLFGIGEARTTADAERPVVIQQVAGKDIVSWALADLADFPAAVFGGVGILAHFGGTGCHGCRSSDLFRKAFR